MKHKYIQNPRNYTRIIKSLYIYIYIRTIHCVILLQWTWCTLGFQSWRPRHRHFFSSFAAGKATENDAFNAQIEAPSISKQMTRSPINLKFQTFKPPDLSSKCWKGLKKEESFQESAKSHVPNYVWQLLPFLQSRNGWRSKLFIIRSVVSKLFQYLRMQFELLWNSSPVKVS